MHDCTTICHRMQIFLHRMNNQRSKTSLFHHRSFVYHSQLPVNNTLTHPMQKSCQISRRSWLRRSSLTFVASNEIISQLFRGDVAYAMDDVDENPLCDLTVSAFRKGDRIVYLIDTAHISEDSATKLFARCNPTPYVQSRICFCHV